MTPLIWDHQYGSRYSAVSLEDRFEFFEWNLEPSEAGGWRITGHTSVKQTFASWNGMLSDDPVAAQRWADTIIAAFMAWRQEVGA